MKILCSICARKGSKGLKNKSLKKFNVKPLISHTIDQAKKSNIFTRIVCSSDSKEILKLAIKKKIDLTIRRKKTLSSDISPKKDAIEDLIFKSEKHFNENYDYIIDLDVSAPTRKIQDIKNCFKLIKKVNHPCNLVTLCESRKNPYFNMITINKKKLKKTISSKKFISARQMAPKVYDMNASIYIWSRKGFFKYKKIINSKTIYYIMPKFSSIDIDDIIDFQINEYLFKKYIKIKKS